MAFFSGELRASMEAIPLEILQMSTDDLEEKRIPTDYDYLLRKSMWKQIEIAQKNGISEISNVLVYGPVCSRQAFDAVIKSPLRIAWLMIPPDHDVERMRGILGMSLGRLGRKMATMDINEKSLGNYLRAIEFLMNRVHGPVIQKVEAKHAHLNLNKPIISEAPDHDRLESIREKLAAAREVTETQEKING